jgi:hypothetical protein
MVVGIRVGKWRHGEKTGVFGRNIFLPPVFSSFSSSSSFFFDPATPALLSATSVRGEYISLSENCFKFFLLLRYRFLSFSHFVDQAITSSFFPSSFFFYPRSISSGQSYFLLYSFLMSYSFHFSTMPIKPIAPRQNWKHTLTKMEGAN